MGKKKKMNEFTKLYVSTFLLLAGIGAMLVLIYLQHPVCVCTGGVGS